jgi:hypothetical protein
MLSEFLESAITMKMLSDVDIWRILLQVTTACYAMSLSKMIHNDLHSDNIWIETFPTPQQFVYTLEHHTFAFTSRYFVRVYDFDRSYVASLGPNHFLDDALMIPSQKNVFIPNGDILKLFGYVYNTRGREFNSRIKDVLCRNDKSRKLLDDVYTGGQFLRNPNTGRVLTSIDCARCFIGIGDIIARVGVLAKTGTYHGGKINFTAVCNQQMFDVHGVLKVAQNVERYRSL